MAGRDRPAATGARTSSAWTSPTPACRTSCATTSRRLVDLGVDYFKLDFLYGGAVPGRAARGRGPAWRPTASGLALVREAVGPDVYLVGCGAPLLPSVGLVDAMRVSPDTFHEGGEDGSAGLRGLMPLAARAWQQGRFWVNDPDCLVARPSYRLRERWAAEARPLRRAAVVLRPGRRPRRLGPGAPSGRCWPTGGSGAPLPPDRVREGAELARAEGSA